MTSQPARRVAVVSSTFAGEVAFDTTEAAESALHFVAAELVAEGFFVRADDGWYTAATAGDFHAGYVRLWFPVEGEPAEQRISTCLECGRAVPPTQFRCDRCDQGEGDVAVFEAIAKESALDAAMWSDRPAGPAAEGAQEEEQVPDDEPRYGSFAYEQELIAFEREADRWSGFADYSDIGRRETEGLDDYETTPEERAEADAAYQAAQQRVRELRAQGGAGNDWDDVPF